MVSMMEKIKQDTRDGECGAQRGRYFINGSHGSPCLNGNILLEA